MISNDFRKISNVVPELHAMTVSETTLYKINVEKVHVFKKVCKDPSSLILIKMNITLTEKLSSRQKIFVQTINYKRKLFFGKSVLVSKS